MPVKKLKPIEERDPCAALVLDAYDRLIENSPLLSAVLRENRPPEGADDVNYKVFRVDFVNRKRP